MTLQHLSEKKCIPCNGNVTALNQAQAQELLSQLDNGWSCGAAGHLYKQYNFKNFKLAMDFANKIAAIAEQEQHHPNLIIAWGLCGVEIWTHAINGVSENDFILAAKIDQSFKNSN